MARLTGTSALRGAAEYFTLRYSRKQEYEADDLGVRYLAAAGYDPTTLVVITNTAQLTDVVPVAQGDDPEQIVGIPTLVPLYVTYLTAVPSGSSIAYYDDVYGRDAARLAAFDAGSRATR